MANPKELLSQANGFFQRNNVFEQMIQDMLMMIENIRTMKSRKKLMVYKMMLEVERLEQMEKLLNPESPHNPQGVKIDRPY